MNGMYCRNGFAYTSSDEVYSVSYTYSLRPTPTIGQLSSTDFAVVGHGMAEMGFTRVEWLDGGVTRHDDYGGFPEYPKIIVRNGLTRADWTLKVKECWCGWLVNFFFWYRVS